MKRLKYQLGGLQPVWPKFGGTSFNEITQSHPITGMAPGMNTNTPYKLENKFEFGLNYDHIAGSQAVQSIMAYLRGKKQERDFRDYDKSQQNPLLQIPANPNTSGDSLYGSPLLKKGGPSPAKASEMLRDGTANKKPLTSKQKKYFQCIAHGGCKGQYGGEISSEIERDIFADPVEQKVQDVEQSQAPIQQDNTDQEIQFTPSAARLELEAEGYSLPEANLPQGEAPITLDDFKKGIANSEGAGYFSSTQIKDENGRASSSAFGRYQFIKGTRQAVREKYFPHMTHNQFEQEYKTSPQFQEQVMDKYSGYLLDKYQDPREAATAFFLGEGRASKYNDKKYRPTPGNKTVGQYLKDANFQKGGTTSPYKDSLLLYNESKRALNTMNTVKYGENFASTEPALIEQAYQRLHAPESIKRHTRSLPFSSTDPTQLEIAVNEFAKPTQAPAAAPAARPLKTVNPVGTTNTQQPININANVTGQQIPEQTGPYGITWPTFQTEHSQQTLRYPDKKSWRAALNRFGNAQSVTEGVNQGTALYPGAPMQKGGPVAYNPNLAAKDKPFQNWFTANTPEGKAGISYSDKLDYDMYSWYRNNPSQAASPWKEGQHWPDTYKRPNHPTFSNESIYSTPENPGGHWEGDKYIPQMKKGGIHIKKENRGKFTEYCGGKVTGECISKGKNSSDPAVRKRATFAANARKWNHEDGGTVKDTIEEYKKGGWIKKAVNPSHKGYCTPMTKATCTPRRKALARTFKKHHGFHKKEEGGPLEDYKEGGQYFLTDEQINNLHKQGYKLEY